jgi:hypothetical protein
MTRLKAKIGDLVRYVYFPVPIYGSNFRSSEHLGVVIDKAGELVYIVHSLHDNAVYRVIKDDIQCIVS